ncbi:MAG: hypothetical protein HYZ92_04440 [Candidatus Omnitrophica bacterium]|nr:hypothetical protein [Candidatus Omnitrophota bacterium]
MVTRCPARQGRGQTLSEIVVFALIVLAIAPFVLLMARKVHLESRVTFLDAPRTVTVGAKVRVNVRMERVSKWFGAWPMRFQPVSFQIRPSSGGRIIGYLDRFGEWVEVDDTNVQAITDRDGQAGVRVVAQDPGEFVLTASLTSGREPVEESWQFSAQSP